MKVCSVDHSNEVKVNLLGGETYKNRGKKHGYEWDQENAR